LIKSKEIYKVTKYC